MNSADDVATGRNNLESHGVFMTPAGYYDCLIAITSRKEET